MGFFFEEIFHFAKTTEFILKGGWRTGTLHSIVEHQSPGLISSYLAGEDKSTKNVPAAT